MYHMLHHNKANFSLASTQRPGNYEDNCKRSIIDDIPYKQQQQQQ